MTFLGQRKNVESLSSGRTLSSAEGPCAPEGWLPSLQKREEEQEHCGSVLRSGSRRAIAPHAHLFPAVQAGEKAKGERVSC